MIIPDEKKALMTIMSKRHPKDGKTSQGPMKQEMSMREGGEEDGRHAAAEDAIMAMHEKSPQKLMEALANFMDIHMNVPKPEESDE